MHKFRTRLTLLFTLVIGLSALVSGIFMEQVLERSQLSSIKQNKLREINIIVQAITWKSEGSPLEKIQYYTYMAEQYKPIAQSRITFIQKDGVVLGDSDLQAQQMENHLHREEIVEAGLRGAGYSIRYSKSTKSNMLYVAVPILLSGSVEGYGRLAISLEQIDSSIRQLWLILISGLFILFLIATFVSYRIAHKLTKPLEKITKVAEQISNLDYGSRVDLNNKDEIGQLGNAINTMAHSLQLQVNHIQENESRLKSVLDNMVNGVMMIDKVEKIVLLNRSAEQMLGFTATQLLTKNYTDVHLQPALKQRISDSIVEQESLHEEMVFNFPKERIVEIHLEPMQHPNGDWAGVLIVMHDISSIRRLEMVRSEFVANVTHELKTPITAVKGFAETLLTGAMEDPVTAKSFLQIIYDESERINRLISDILELSQIETKSIPIQFSPIHMQSFFDKLLETIDNEASKKGIHIELQVEDHLFIEADEDRLRQIFINLISNAITYTPAYGQVKIKVKTVQISPESEHDKIRMTISDTGMGIPKKDLPRIFERFYRVDKARTRSSGGTGLGLSIVKHLVELHHGDLNVESTEGIGTTFIIELPVIQ